jgi:three-Cys-motif partner protein
VSYLEDPENWVRGYLRVLHYLGQLIEYHGPKGVSEEAQEFRPHNVTYLKLMLVMAYARNSFLEVGSTLQTKLRFLDILSAAGLSYAQENARPVPSSAFTVPLAHQEFRDLATQAPKRFDEVWTFDENKDALTTLEARRQALVTKAGLHLPRFEYVPGEANKNVQQIVEEFHQQERGIPLRKRPLTLAFIDNIGFDIHMDTIEAIQAKIRADLVIHLPIHAVFREVQRYRREGRGNTPLDRFFGGREWLEIKTMEDVAPVYHQCVQARTHREFQRFDPVWIQGGKSSFAMCIYTRKRRDDDSAEQWVGRVTKLATACGKLDYKSIDEVFEHGALGRKNLFDFGEP